MDRACGDRPRGDFQNPPGPFICLINKSLVFNLGPSSRPIHLSLPTSFLSLEECWRRGCDSEVNRVQDRAKHGGPQLMKVWIREAELWVFSEGLGWRFHTETTNPLQTATVGRDGFSQRD